MSPETTAELLQGLTRGALATAVLAVGVVVLQAVEAWRFTPSRGALGALGHSLRAWRRAWRDHEPGTGLLSALTSLVPAAVAAAALVVVPHTPMGRTVVAALLLPAIAAPILGALAGGSAARARLSLDDALMRSARQGILLTAVVIVASTRWLAPVGVFVVVALLRLHHPGMPGFKPRADLAVGDGTRLAQGAGDRGAVLVVIALVVSGVVELLSASTAVPLVLLTTTSLGIVSIFVVFGWLAVRVVEWLGPLTMQGVGSRGPLLLLASAAVIRFVTAW